MAFEKYLKFSETCTSPTVCLTKFGETSSATGCCLTYSGLRFLPNFAVLSIIFLHFSTQIKYFNKSHYFINEK